RYRYLELIIEESLIVASFAAVVLTIYIYGIRTIGDWVTSRYGVRAGVVEALLILALALAAAPLRSWLGQRFHKLFEREAALYRQIVSRISSHAGRYQQLPDLLDFVEQQTMAALKLRRVRILAVEAPHEGEPEKSEEAIWAGQVLEVSRRNDWLPVEDNSLLESRGFTTAYPLRRDANIFGVLLIDAVPGSLTE